MTITLGDIVPPHEVRNDFLAASLALAYQRGHHVNPPVVVDLGDPDHLYALSGSHRIAALKCIYTPDTDVQDFVLEVFKNDIVHAAEYERDHGHFHRRDDVDAVRETIELLGSGLLRNFAFAVRTLWRYLPRNAREALEDQNIKFPYTARPGEEIDDVDVYIELARLRDEGCLPPAEDDEPIPRPQTS